MAKALCEEKRIEIIGMHSEGYNKSQIAEKLKCNRNTVASILKRWQDEKTIQPKKRLGARRKLSKQDERFLVINAKKDRFLTRAELANLVGNKVSKTTISSTLKRHNLSFRPSNP